ncbi:MAG TPA: hypothetical protein VGG63_01275 [Steroidobacteraceae bacterium]|jgi:2-polyprenyl-3-methyl-5-hydroxy-6-metoxy-1,4-benzoquinol methylase
MPRRREVCPEILDDLSPTDPRAIRSRRDLRRVNRVIGSCGIITRAVRRALVPAAPHRPLRILELGAGDGSLALRLARRLATRWREADITLLDRQSLVDAATAAEFARLGWVLRPLSVDVLEWARASSQQQPAHWDLVLVNLFLHHFEDGPLHELLAAVASRCDVLVACEPWRSLPAIIGSRLMPAIGVSADTLYDALASVRAGFRGSELSQLWPASGAGWKLEEHRAGLFSHLFVAARGEDAR